MSPAAYRVFSGLLAELQRSRFPIGVDHHLRIARLLDGLGGSHDPASLKTLLCPLVATNADEQKRFYAIFDRYYAARPASRIEPPPEKEPARKGLGTQLPDGKRVGLRRSLVGVALVGLGMLAVWISTRDDGPAATTATCDSLATGRAPVNTDSCPRTRPDTVRGRRAPSSRGPNIPTRITPVEPRLVLALSTPVPTWYQQNYGALLVGAVLLPFALLALAEMLRRRRQRTSTESVDAKPPYHWTICAPPASPWYRGREFGQAVRLLRIREDAGSVRLDVERSIAATVEEGGYPTWRFRSDTRPPEYLFLIDRAGQRDHQARHYASLVKALDDEDVFLEQWFFDRDPRICTTDSTKPTTPLAELARRWSSSRLVVFADGESLVDPVSGDLAEWTSELEAWRDRAVLTPSTGWGDVETRSLRDRFVVRPGTLEGLKAIGYDFTVETGPNRRDWVQRSGDTESPAVASPEDLEQLRTAFGVELYQWLCACAVYPELHWDLTVYLGSLLGGEKLVTERNLLALVRLAWFRTGSIPDRIRQRLIGDLKPDVRRMVHQKLAELLEQNPPDQSSFAARRYAENLAIQRLGAADKVGERRHLLGQLQALAPERLFREAEIAGLEPRLPRSPVARLVPRRWWGRLFHDGDPLYGLKLGARATVAGCLSLLAWQAVPHPVPPHRSFGFAPDSVTLTRTGPGLRLSISADSLDGSVSVEDTTIGVFDRPDHLRARAAGTTRLRAIRVGDTAWAKIAVVDVAPPVGLLGIAAATSRMPLGGALQLVAVPRDTLNPPLPGSIRWSSSNNSIASVSSAGILTGRAVGTAIVTASDSAARPVVFSVAVMRPRASPRDTLEEPILFAAGQPAIEPGIRQMLSRKTGILRDYPSIRIKLTGQAPVGLTNEVDSFARQMATTVRSYLARSGVDPARIDVQAETAKWVPFEPVPIYYATVRGVETAVVGGAFEKAVPPTAVDSSIGELFISPPAPTLAPGDTLRLAIKNPPTRAVLSWRSENSDVARVSGSILVAISPGTTRIVAQRGSQTGSAVVSVRGPSPPPVVPTNTTLQVGDTRRLQLRLAPGDANAPAVLVPIGGWSSLNAEIASVDSSGLIRGERAGRTEIVATTDRGRVTVLVTVTPPYTGKTDVQVTNPRQSAVQAPVPAADTSTSPRQAQSNPSVESANRTPLALAVFAERARENLRAFHRASPAPLKPGLIAEIQKFKAQTAVYGFTSVKLLVGRTPNGPVYVRADSSAEFDVEIHMVENGNLELLGFATVEDASLLRRARVPSPLRIALSPSMLWPCLVSAPLDDYVSSVTFAQDTLGNRLLVLGEGKRMFTIGAPTECYPLAAQAK